MEHLAVVARSPLQAFSQRWTVLHHMAPNTTQLTSRYSAQPQGHHSSSRRQTSLTSLWHAAVLSLSHRSPFNPSPAKAAASLLMERVSPQHLGTFHVHLYTSYPPTTNNMESAQEWGLPGFVYSCISDVYSKAWHIVAVG